MKTRLSRTAKRRLKTAAIYLVAFGVAFGAGCALYFVARPYAMAHRQIPELYGGEQLLPVAVPFFTFFARDIIKEVKRMRSESRSTDK